MIFDVTNHDLQVGTLKIGIVSSSSLILIGDTSTIQLASYIDTPSDSLIVGPFVPLTPEG